ncbi:MAG: 4-hydroxy-tetrahydrodipicolinate synthase [Dysgonamonadaceae bacterium]|nr:4-hydroxy-tetrahydrodipicolinate synthase [Dysgonamonadaceae bacterium]MDD3310034.1 4-hydroxy-tetrahydrodipicolinate synthase [Dysgonamonadaceae bacterium]MDD4399576.1 4-hydroxy-tetrahydrodipicolinate synthase [Dysgonamonadaceae bacterium]
MANLYLKGMGVAMVTPFLADLSVDVDALKKLVDFQIENGTDYIVALGTTAETPTLNAEERRLVIKTIVNQVKGRVPVIMGVGGNCTAELVYTLKNFDFTGIDAILSVTPYYNKPSQEGLYQHYRALNEVSPLPIILYNVPGRTGVNMTAETTLRLANDCKNIIAIKEASGKLDQVAEIINNKPAEFQVISGDDGVTLEIIKAGGVGVISVLGNVFPREFSGVVHQALNDNFVQAESLNSAFVETIKLLFADGNPSGAKCMLSKLGYIQNVLRLPLVPVCNSVDSQIDKMLKSFHK